MYMRPGNTPIVPPFADTLGKYGLNLQRDETHTLQVNVGLLCNQACRHCHIEAGPDRKEIMRRETMDEVIAYASRVSFKVIDITGGAPEMIPGLEYLLDHIAPLTTKIMLRSNLTALAEKKSEDLLDRLQAYRVAIIASFPSVNSQQTASLRGQGVWEKSIEMLIKLNGLGYGQDHSGLELNLVANPAGAFLPVAQCQAEKRFKQELGKKWGITFNNLYTFANVPLGRYRRWLEGSGNFRSYMERLAASFNPATVNNLMCRTLVSVSWDGYLFDCDFNLAAGLYLGMGQRHISTLKTIPPSGTPIAISDHCYACTAGSGFT